MNKTIKKIVALGFTGAMALTTLAVAANAATLADYPSPFVSNGAFVGKIVIGEKADAVDLLGTIDISASLQRESVTSAGTSNGQTTAMAEDGYLFQESDNLILGTGLVDVIPTVDDTELPDMLASGTVEADDGSEYDYDVEINLETGSEVSSDINLHSLNDDYSTPIVFYDLTSTDPFYTVSVDFTDEWTLNEDSADDSGINEGSATIELFGRSYTFDPNNYWDDDVLTLYGSDTTLVVGKGETKTITYNGEEYTVEVIGGNSDQSTAILRIGSQTTTVEEGDSKTIGGLPVYVKDVFVSNIGGDDVSVQLFLGSNTLELDIDGTVTLNNVELDEVNFAYTKSGTENWEGVNLLEFTVTPSDADSEIEYILPGEDYVDPLFGSFKFHFVGDEDLMANREQIAFDRNGKKLDLTFTPRGGGSETTVTPFEGDTTTGDVETDWFVGETFNELVEDNIFVYNEDATLDDKAITHVLQIDKINVGNDTTDVDFEVVFNDLTFNKKYTVDSGTKAIDSKIDLFVDEGADEDHIDLAATAGGADALYLPEFFTNAGAMVQFVGADNSTVIANASEIDGLNWFLVTEDVDDDVDTSTADPFFVTISYDGSSDDEYDVGVTGILNGNTDDDDNYDHYLTDFGTYVVQETDDSGKNVNVYVPETEVNYDMFLLPVESTVTVTSSTGGSAVILNPTAVGMAIFDSEATLGSKPYIVVGGPCGNTVAAELMGNPADCAAGFTEGKAMIKLYSDKNALLVAGYSGKDTQGASRVLSNYKDYEFTGTELEVITANFASLSVNNVN